MDKKTFYYHYATNFLKASKDFQEEDKTLSDIFLHLAEMMMRRSKEAPEIITMGEPDKKKSILNKLPEDKREEILDEIDKYAIQIKEIENE